MQYFKKLREGGEGEFEFIKVDTNGRSAEEILRDHYLASNWADATEEEYNAQIAEAEGEEEEVSESLENVESDEDESIE